jgi:serine phosphatase RsbU (regulator of sigma subunit)
MLERQRLERQMAFAGEVQRHLLPQPGTQPRGLRLATRYQPADAVGGDLLCVRSTGTQTLLALGDVSGKGVPAALLMAAARALFESHARVTSEPAELLELMARDLSDDLDRNAAFLTFCAARHDAATGELRIANAGHAPVLLRNASGVELLEPIDPPIGVLDGSRFGQVSLQMAAGDTLLMASDGLSEREDPDGHQFGIERISQIMVAGDGSPRRIADRLIGAARRFAAGRPRSDDESLLIVQARSGASA